MTKNEPSELLRVFFDRAEKNPQYWLRTAKLHVSELPFHMVACNTWEAQYPDRKPWADLDSETQREWVEVVKEAIVQMDKWRNEVSSL